MKEMNKDLTCFTDSVGDVNLNFYWLRIAVMSISRLLISIAICSTTIGHSFADEVEKKYPLLASLTPSKKELPTNCTPQEFPADAKQFEGLKNCEITIDPKFFVIGSNDLKRLIDVKVVEACYIGMYREDSELGLMGWAFTSEEEAVKAHKAISDNFDNEPERFRLWQQRETVIWLWRDPNTTDSCFEKFEKFVKSKVESAEPSESPKDVTATEKQKFLVLMRKLPRKGEFFTDEGIQRAMPFTRVLLALNEEDIEDYHFYPFAALSAGLFEHKEQQEYATKHFGDIAHPTIKMMWAALLFRETKASDEIGIYLQGVLESEEQEEELQKMIGPDYSDFKKKVKSYRPKKKS